MNAVWSLLGKLARSVGLLLAALALVVCGAWAMLHNAWTTRQLLNWVPGLTVQAPQGALLGDFRAERVVLALPRGGQLALEQPVWRGLALRWDAGAPYQFGLRADALGAARLDLQWVAAPPEPQPATQPPTDLVLPVSLDVTHLQLGEIRSNLLGEVVVSGLDAAVALQSPVDGSQAGHRVVLRALALQGGPVPRWGLRGEARVLARGAMTVAATLVAERAAETAQGDTGELNVAVEGPLRRLVWRAAGALARPGEAPASVQMNGVLDPFAPWPVLALAGTLKDLDLSGWHAGWPRTGLNATVSLAPQEGGVGLSGEVAVTNSQAGALDAGRVPLRALKARMQWQALPGQTPWEEWLRGAVVDLEARLPVTPGRGVDEATLFIQGQPGHDEGVRVRWQALDARALHGAAPDLSTQASVTLRPQWQGASLSGASLQGEMSGTHGRAAQSQPVRLTLDAQYRPGEILLRSFNLRAGGGQADVTTGRFQWHEAGGWQADAAARFQALDPSVWLPWPAAVQGRHALNGRLVLAVDADWRGQAELQLDDSVLAGVPVAAQLQWRSPKDVARMALQAQARAGGNTVEGKVLVPWRRGAQGQWEPVRGLNGEFQVQAPHLAALGPLAPLWRGRDVQGRLSAQVRFQGEWPAIETDGQMQAHALLHLGADGTRVQLGSVTAQWDWRGGQAQAPVALQARLEDLQLDAVRVDEATFSLDGTVGAHQGRWQMLAVLPPSGEAAQRWRAMGSLQGQGRVAAEVGEWRGHLREVRVTQETPSVQEWVRVADLPLSWRQDADSASWRVGAASLELAGLPWRVTQAMWQRPRGGEGAQGELQADLVLEPFQVARWATNWRLRDDVSGDLVVAGSVRLRHSAQAPWQLQAQLSRQSGDLSVIEAAIQGGQAQRLGIREARVTLQADQGVWELTQELDGRTLGTVKGRQRVTVSDPHRLPAAADPVSGELVLQVESLRPWGNWLPAGWRLGGRLDARAQMGGTLGGPRFSGRVTGDNLSASQLLEGIAVSQGRLVLELEGERARLLELSLQDGLGGQLRVTGQAELGEQPLANLDATATRFAALQRVDRRVVVSGQLQARLAQDDVQARGQLRVDEGLIDISRSDAPTIGDDVRVINRPGVPDDPEEAGGRNGRDVQRRVDVAVGIDLGERLRLRGRGLEATLMGQLRFTTPANRPSLSGTINVRDGVYAAYGQKLVIDRGGITFTGPIENPRLDLRAMRAQSPAAQADDVKVGVTITGTAQDPRIRLYSEPAMSETEKLSWLLLGRAPTGLDGADIGLLQTAAVALLSGEGGGPSDTLVSRLGLDELSIRQTDGTVRETVVNVGKQVSERWYVGYERNLNATAGNWQLIYRVAQRFTLRAQAGEDNALDLIWQFRWRGREQLSEPAAR